MSNAIKKGKLICFDCLTVNIIKIIWDIPNKSMFQYQQNSGELSLPVTHFNISKLWGIMPPSNSYEYLKTQHSNVAIQKPLGNYASQ